MSELRTRMDNDMLLRGMADRTRESYVAAVARMVKFYRRSPEQISAPEVQAYLLHMLQEEKLSWSTCNIAAHALRFLYHTTLGRDRTQFCIPAAKQPSRLPEILSQEEIVRLFDSTPHPKHRALLMTTYAAGLRVSEVVNLKVTDIDSDRMSLRVEQGKGAKDRYTLLSPRLLEELRSYWRRDRPAVWLFPSRTGRPLDVSAAQKIYYTAKLRARITKRGGIHALRHYAESRIMPSGVPDHPWGWELLLEDSA